MIAIQSFWAFLGYNNFHFDTFFVGKATEHLIGEGVTPEQLNDDRIGRALDKYYQAGTTKLFTAIALKAAMKFQVEMKSVHLDSSSISVEGEYKSCQEKSQGIEAEPLERELEMKAIKIVHGYSRDRRPDLKQFIIDTIVTGDGDVPLYLKIDNGNADDKSVFVERLKEFQNQWTLDISDVSSGAFSVDKWREASQQFNPRPSRCIKAFRAVLLSILFNIFKWMIIDIKV